MDGEVWRDEWMETERKAGRGSGGRSGDGTGQSVAAYARVVPLMYTCTAVPLTYCTSDVRAGTAVPLAQWPDASHQEEHRDHLELKGVGGEGGRLLMPLDESAPPLLHARAEHRRSIQAVGHLLLRALPDQRM